MNRRDSLKAALGGLLGMMGVKAATPVEPKRVRKPPMQAVSNITYTTRFMTADELRELEYLNIPGPYESVTTVFANGVVIHSVMTIET